jgi:hypothetical protein
LSQDEGVGYYIGFSTVGAVFILIIALLGGQPGVSISDTERILVGIAFIFCALFGISIAVRPGWLGRLARKGIHGADKAEYGETSDPERRRRLGHHPECEGFNSHRITIRNSTYCAGCLGLSMGAIAAIILTVLHIVVPYRLSGFPLYVLIFIGLTIVFLNYGEIMMSVRNPHVHVVSNTFLVVGFLLVVLGVFELTGSILYGLFGILISFLWLDTRIRLSKWRHHRICEECGADCKAY